MNPSSQDTWQLLSKRGRGYRLRWGRDLLVTALSEVLHVLSVCISFYISHKYSVFAQSITENVGPGQRGGWL